jgi:hypothetical protein
MVSDEHLINENGVEEEDFGIAYLNKVHGFGFTWVQSSVDGSFRKNRAGKGYTYDKANDAFISGKPYESWELNDSTFQWEAPISYPDDDNTYTWNEDTQTWDDVE